LSSDNDALFLEIKGTSIEIEMEVKSEQVITASEFVSSLHVIEVARVLGC